MSSQKIPRSEYPRPQMVRDNWINLNGTWEFEIDQGKSGKARNLPESSKLKDEIIVPFSPESKLSGVEYTDFMAAVWYKREFELPKEWTTGRILIHFGAVDYQSEVWINGEAVGTHKGGYTSFSFDITEQITPGKNLITVYAEDDLRSGKQPAGKQSGKYESHNCYYTRTTGIWQTVWLEIVPENYISSVRYLPDVENCSLQIEASFSNHLLNYTFRAEALYDGVNVGMSEVKVLGNNINLTIQLEEEYLWGPGNPELYDLVLSLNKDGDNIDKVESYFGLRNISFDDNVMMINGKAVFQRLVLDQGFYPEGIYTAPTDKDLKKDIELAMNLGFNGARLHEKIFEPRFLYWADRLGYLVWEEHANWGLDITSSAGLENFLPEWIEAVQRDFNHPAIVGWCPFNETWDRDGTKQDDQVLRITYNVTKAIDKTRPVIDTSGNFHVVTDIFDIHDYEQDPIKFAAKFEEMKNGGQPYVNFSDRQQYKGQPYFVSEFGGIWWNPEREEGWGYGERPKSEEEFIERYRGMIEALLSNPQICAFCYTQLYDVEQEVNGLYTYDRKPKFDAELIKGINQQKASIE